MNKKGQDTNIMYGVLLGIIIAGSISIVFLWPIIGNMGNQAYASVKSEDKPSPSTLSSFNSLVGSIENKDKQQILEIEGKYIITLFNKGSEKGIGGFLRPGSCFDVNQSCICLCITNGFNAGLDDCFKKENIRKTICKELDVDIFELIGFENYIGPGSYSILIEVETAAKTNLARLIKENI